GCGAAGSFPAGSTIAFAFCAIAASIPCTHCDGWPWFCQVVTFTPASFAMRVMWSLIDATNGTWLEGGMTKIVFAPALALASNAGPGALNVGTARCASRFAFAPAV